MPGKKPKRQPPRAKKPWEPPRVKTGHLFESNSLSCGKNSPGNDECLQNPTQS